MARTKNNQRSANRVAVDVGATGTNPVSKMHGDDSGRQRHRRHLGGLDDDRRRVASATTTSSSTPSTTWASSPWWPCRSPSWSGLVATDRLVLSIRQRVMLQSAHRTTGLIAVSALVMHVWTKVVEHAHQRSIDVFIPFMAPYNRLLIGFGTISGWIMVLVMWTGIARARFIGQDRPWLWRSIHSISYLMWPIALVHGLAAGRPPRPGSTSATSSASCWC